MGRSRIVRIIPGWYLHQGQIDLVSVNQYVSYEIIYYNSNKVFACMQINTCENVK